MTWVLAVIGAAALALGGLRCRLAIVAVRGRSMLPALRPGDRVLVRKRSASRVRVGDVVVVAAPREPRRTWMIKRVVAVPGDPVPRERVPALWGRAEPRVPAGHLVVLGDNPDESYDSRAFGYVRPEALLGVVVRGLAARSASSSASSTASLPTR